MTKGSRESPRGIHLALYLVLAGAVVLAAFLALSRGDGAWRGGGVTAGVFGPNVRVDDTGNLLNAQATDPKAFVDANGTIYVVWDDGRAAPGSSSQEDLYFAKSVDGGSTYSRNVPVAVTANMSGGNSDIDVAEDGSIFVVWGERGVSSNPGIEHLYFSKSVDGGNTFSSPVVIDGHRWDENCVCTGIALARSGGKLFAGWTQNVSDVRGGGFFLARSADRGATWGTPMRIDDGGTDDLEVPDLAVDGAGTVYAVWSDATTYEVRLARSVDSGLTFGASLRVSTPGWLAVEGAIAARGPHVDVLWYSIRSPADYSGALFLSQVAGGGTAALPPTQVLDVPANSTHVANIPSVAVDGQGFVDVAWIDSRTDPYGGDVYFARSLDGGRTFGRNERIEDTPLPDGTSQAKADVAANGNGSVVVVWDDLRRDTDPDWGGDVYSAVPTYLPDLSVEPSDLSWLPPSPTEGAPVVIDATIHNIGWNASAPTTARFYNGTPPAPQIGADQPLPFLPIGGGANVSIAWTAPPPGTYVVCVLADPDNLVAELNKTNNLACRAITVVPAPMPDLALTPADIRLAPAPPVANGTAVRVTATVHNVGDASSVATAVRFFDGIPPAPPIGTDQPLPPLAPNATADVSVTWTTTPPGTHDVCVVVDPDNVVPESNESNNVACVAADVLPPETRPDYVPRAPQPVSPTRAGLSRPVVLSVEVLNEGNATGNATATLAFYNASTPGAPFATFPILPLAPSETSARFTAKWISPATPGAYQVVADVDYRNDLVEWNESNNRHAWTVDVLAGPLTDLVVGAPNYTAAFAYVTSATPLSFSALDQSGAGIRNTTYRVDAGAWVNYTATGPFTLATEGAHIVEWHSEDFVGNMEPVANASLRVDDTPPTTTLTVGDPKYVAATTFVRSSTPIALATTDGGITPVGVASTEYRIDGGAWTPYAGAFTLTGEGPHAVAYRATDRLENAEPTRTLGATVDDTPPATTIAPTTGPFTPATAFTLTATDNGSGVARAEYRIDGGPWIGYTNAFTVAAGSHVIGYRSADRLNNTEAERALPVTVETPRHPAAVNWKPFVAAVFAAVLVLFGIRSSRRAPWPTGTRRALRAFVFAAMPFVAAESATGVVSLLTGLLAIPPLLGMGTAVDLAMLVAGIVVSAYRVRKRKPST